MTADSPRSVRRSAPRWFDVRLLVGIVIVVLPMVIGAHVLAAADRYASVYVARRALVPGEHLVAADLMVGRVRFDGQGTRYIAAGRPPVGYVVTRYVAGGELVPVAALTGAAPAIAAERLVTVLVGAGHAPLDLTRGDVVDIYGTRRNPARDKTVRPRLVIGAAPVESVSTSGALSSSAAVSVVIEVPAVSVPDVVRAVESGTLDLVRVPGAVVVAGITPPPTAFPPPTALPAPTATAAP